MSKKTIGLFLVSLVILLFGCGKRFDPGTSKSVENTPDEDLIVVGVSQVGSESVWRTANTASIQQAFTKDKGYFLIFENARQKQENQIKSLRSFISQQVDYIIFSPITEDGWETVLQEAKDANIPVILMDRMVDVHDESLYTTWVGSDFEKEGENAGKWLASHLTKVGREGEDINIVVLKGTEGSTSVIGRTDGFNLVAKKHENWKILEQTDADFTTTKGRQVMKGMLENYDRIDVVVSQNDDMTFGAIEAINDVGKTTGVDGDIIVISFDAVKAALQMVEGGVINADVECNPVQGEFVEGIIKDLEANRLVDKQNYIPEKVFTKDNVGSVINERTY